MKARTLTMLLAVLIVGLLSIPSSAVTCGTWAAVDHYQNSWSYPCVMFGTNCGSNEAHWHIKFSQSAGVDCEGSAPKARGYTMTGAWWGYNMYSPNKSTAFGARCIDFWNTCNRCMNSSTCSNTDLTATCCY